MYTTIRYESNTSAAVELAIFNLLGEKVKTIVNSYQKMGEYQVKWNRWNDEGKELPSGVYLYALKTANQSILRKMILVR